MNGAELRKSLISTVRHLLDYKENIKFQLKEAKRIILLSVQQTERESLSPITIEKDALWFNYLVDSLNQVEKDIALAFNALSQLGVSIPPSLASNEKLNRNIEKNQGIVSLDFSVPVEKEL